MFESDNLTEAEILVCAVISTLISKLEKILLALHMICTYLPCSLKYFSLTATTTTNQKTLQTTRSQKTFRTTQLLKLSPSSFLAT